MVAFLMLTYSRAINRMIFDTTRKYDSATGTRTLTTPEIRQIGGRAGRFRTSADDEKSKGKEVTTPPASPADASDGTEGLYPSPPSQEKQPGFVASFEDTDMRIIGQAMQRDPQPITKFGITPTNDMIELFYNAFPQGVPYSFILARIFAKSQVSKRFFFCNPGDTLDIADLIHPITNLSVQDRISMCFAPLSTDDPQQSALIVEMASAVANHKGGELLELKAINLEVLDAPNLATREHLKKLESLHKCLVLYNWMSFRFSGVFISRPLVIKTKKIVEERIDECLLNYKFEDIDKSRKRNKDIQELDTESDGEHNATADDVEEYPEYEDLDERIHSSGVSRTGNAQPITSSTPIDDKTKLEDALGTGSKPA